MRLFEPGPDPVMTDDEYAAYIERQYGPQGVLPKTWPNGVPRGMKRGTGYVYFLLAHENMVRPMVKIGFSLRSPDARLGDCQTGSPVKLKMVAFIFGTRFDEADLHKRFGHLRSHREWFFFEGDLRVFVEELAQ